MKLAVALVGLALLMPAVASVRAGDMSPAEIAEINGFRETQAKIMRGPQSALGMVSLENLKPGDTTIGSAAGSRVWLDHVSPRLGIVQSNGDSLVFVPDAGAQGLTVGGKPAVAGPVAFDADGTSPVFAQGSVSFVLRHKFGFWLVGRDTQAPALVGFHGLNWYAPDARYRIVAKWVPWPAKRVLRVANVLGQVNEEASYGYAEFTLDGHTYRLEPSVYESREKPLFFVFKDWTSRTTTYGGGRFLDARMPDHGLSALGTVVLDFNMARNPLCAFSPHTSCPLPPVGNRMAVAVPAGEKRYE